MVLPPPLHVGHPQESVLKLPWRTWVCPVRTRLGGGTVAWTWMLEAPGMQGSGSHGCRWAALWGSFPASGHSAPVNTRHGGGGCGCLADGEHGNTRCVGKLVAAGAAGEVPVESFSNCWQLVFKGLSGGPSLLLGTAGAQRVPLADVLTCCSAYQALKGHPPRDLPPLGSCWPCRWGEREAIVMAPPPSPQWLSSVVLPPWLPSSPPRAFVLWSPSSYPLGLSPHSQQQSAPWDCPQSLPPAPSHSVYQRTCLPVQGVAAAAWIVYADLTPFRPSQISCFPLQQPQMPLPCPKLLLLRGDLTSLQFLHPFWAGPVSLSPSFSLSPFILPSFVWIYMFLSGGQGYCQLSVGAPWGPLHLKMYSWCTHGERSIPHPPTPPTSHHLSISHIFLNLLLCTRGPVVDRNR